MSSYRREKLSELYRRAATVFVQDSVRFEDALVSVTKVELSEKLSRLIVYYSVWPDKKEADVLKLLQGLKSELRAELAQKVKTKFVPEIEFKLDESEKKRLRIDELLKESK